MSDFRISPEEYARVLSVPADRAIPYLRRPVPVEPAYLSNSVGTTPPPEMASPGEPRMSLEELAGYTGATPRVELSPEQMESAKVPVAVRAEAALRRYKAFIDELRLRQELSDQEGWQQSTSSSSESRTGRTTSITHDPLRVAAAMAKGGSEKDAVELEEKKHNLAEKKAARTVVLGSTAWSYPLHMHTDNVKELQKATQNLSKLRSLQQELAGQKRTLTPDDPKYKQIMKLVSSTLSVMQGQGAMTDAEQKRSDEELAMNLVTRNGAEALKDTLDVVERGFISHAKGNGARRVDARTGKPIPEKDDLWLTHPATPQVR